MSNYHVMEVSADHDTATVAMHFTVPDEANFASVNIRAALVEYLATRGVDNVVTAVPWLETDNPTEYAALEAGSVFEKIERVEYDVNVTNAAKAAVIDARWTALNATIPDVLRERLKFWGLDRDVT